MEAASAPGVHASTPSGIAVSTVGSGLWSTWLNVDVLAADLVGVSIGCSLVALSGSVLHKGTVLDTISDESSGWCQAYTYLGTVNVEVNQRSKRLKSAS